MNQEQATKAINSALEMYYDGLWTWQDMHREINEVLDAVYKEA